MKKYIFSMVSGLIGVICFAAYNIIGTKMSPDGSFVEPFGLIPIGYLFIFIGVISAIIVAVVTYIYNLLNKKKEK
ncbi:DUF3955 domain-containing protein [Terrisporobacter mayombei]|uniref:DUF3955 domain-containing protein n=1 Tax=Terrisporobacter mayombei TaxID=1541 RepID=A0ABY9PYP0_9FIRM|nr:DUF3955 domain-containing protein [Terrisporobacter mayombei]MCC3868229.1 DUF3955 domain-containing protein [Terrisporobacter mayombei]WMT80368.1 hypothetical protein TEMA_06840 [Terrisporobacter mayombei]